MTEQEKAKKKPRPCTALRFDGAPLREHLVIVHFLSLSPISSNQLHPVSRLYVPRTAAVSSAIIANSNGSSIGLLLVGYIINRALAAVVRLAIVPLLPSSNGSLSLSLRATTTDAIAPIIITPSDLVFSNPPLKQNRRPCDFRPSSTFLSDLYVRHFPFGLSTRPAL